MMNGAGSCSCWFWKVSLFLFGICTRTADCPIPRQSGLWASSRSCSYEDSALRSACASDACSGRRVSDWGPWSRCSEIYLPSRSAADWCGACPLAGSWVCEQLHPYPSQIHRWHGYSASPLWGSEIGGERGVGGHRSRGSPDHPAGDIC